VADGGQFRCYVFWSADEADDSTDWTSKVNYVDTGGAIGTQSRFVRQLGVASRAFDHGGRVFVTCAFASGSLAGLFGPRATLQNTYFTYRDDAFLVAKTAMGRAGGFSPVTGHLPGVALTDGTTGYSWCGTERRVIPLGGERSGYADRGPRDIAIAFDSNEARRCARLGATLYITGGEILQYDGSRLVEVGFHIFPWAIVAIQTAAGNLVDGTYTYKASWRWDNGRGDLDRSTTATFFNATISGGPNGNQLITIPLYVTHKTDSAAAIEWWRTEVDPASFDEPYFLVTSKDPADTTNPNRYLANDHTALPAATVNDELADDDLTDNETAPENGGELEVIAPPAASIILATDTRIFLASVAGDPHRVWYSRARVDGLVAGFNDALVIDVPTEGGAITAMVMHGDTLHVFREHATYAFPGIGFDNTGGGENFGPARTVSTDVGAVSQEAVAFTDQGSIVKSAKGWQLLTRGGGYEYIGAAIADYDAEAVVAIHVLDGQHEIRVLTTARMLVLDTVANQWCERTIDDGLDAVMWRGTHAYLTATGPKVELATYTGVDFGLDVETAWIKPADLQGAVSVRRFEALGEYRGSHKLRWRVAYNYDETYVDDVTWTPSPTTVGGPLQCVLGPSRRNCEAFKVRLTAVSASVVDASPDNEALKLTGLGIEIGIKRGLFRRLGVAQKAGS
jgi:hypothetical protein